MKKNNWLNRKLSFLSIAVILVMSLAAFSYSGYLKANDEISGYQFQIVKNEDGSAADIIGDQTKLKEGVKINKIVNPDGEAMDLQHVSYHVNKNDSYTFQIEFTSETGEHVENIQVAVDTLSVPNNLADKPILPLSEGGNKATNKNTMDGSSATGEKTVRDLKAEKMLENKATSPFLIPMFIEGENTSQGKYSFPGGDIINIADQTFNGLPYKFQKAEISIKEGDKNKTYAIDYYDTVDNKTHYSLAGKSDESQDFEVAYEAPAGAVVSFIFELNTKSYPVKVNNTKESEGFSIKYITGIKTNPDGTHSAQQNSVVKLILTYPLGYYVENAPEGKNNVGIEFSDTNVAISKDDSDKANRTISYTFTYPGNAMTLDVVGDKEDTGLMYGVYDSTANFQNAKEQGNNWWKATNANGDYTSGQPYFGYSSGDSNYGTMMVRGGTPTQVKVEGKQNLVNIAAGTYNSGQVLDFEYTMNRVNLNGRPPYFFWPSPTMSLCYFPNGADVTKDTPISETFPLWSPDWLYDPSVQDTPIITNTYDADNGAKITITVKKSVYTEKATSTQGVKLNVPSYQVHVKIENMKNSFYIKTQGAGSVQGNHYFRDLNEISLAQKNNLADSYFLQDNKDEQGGNTGTLEKSAISSGNIFIDKLAVYNKNISEGTNLNEGGVPWADSNKPFFKFNITPKWGYTNPRVESFGKDVTPIMTNKSIEIEKKELEDSGQTVPNLTLGKYSWFNSSLERVDTSSFHYVMFMPVESLGTIHDMRAIDIKTDKITGTVTNNDEFVSTDAQQNTIVNSDNFDLLENDKIVFNPNFKAPKKPDKVFAGFTATITAPDNPLLPENYTLELAKDVNNTVYFKPGDVISISDFFRRDASILLDSWNKDHNLNKTEQERLNLLMYSSNMKVKINLIYRDATSSEGEVLTAHVNKYLQDVGASGLVYSNTITDSKSIDVIKGTNIVFNKFAETYVNPIDHYTYYLNMEHTVSLPSVTTNDQEIASVKYDRSLTVSYLNSDGTPFTEIVDNTVYKTFKDEKNNNEALIKFPTVSQSPIGKTFDYWTAEELDETGNWISIPDLKITNTEEPAVYKFSSGPDGNNRSIRLKAVWKDITPDSYITIPKNIQLYEKDTNLTPQKDYAGQKVTISYHNVHGSDRTVNVDVLKSFDLSMIDNPSKKIKVSTYDTSGNLLDTSGINSNYARIGVFGNTSGTSKDIWFNTPSQNGNEVYKGEFGITSVPTEIMNSTLFYISNKTQ